MTIDKTASFFPKTRKELFLAHFAPLANAAGEKRWQMSLTMPLMDGKLVGMPEWLSEPFKVVHKVGFGLGNGKSLVELDGMTLRAYATDQSEEPILDLPGVLLKGFNVQRCSKEKASGEVADTELTFRAYMGWNTKAIRFCEKYYQATFYCMFVATQASLSFGPPSKKEEEDDDSQGDLYEGSDEPDNEDSPAAQAKRRGRRVQ